MKLPFAKNAFVALGAAAVFSIALPTHAAIIISEVDAAGSATSSYAADWFELTNTGSSAVNISGWKMDDNSNAFANAVALTGVTSIAAGQSVVFIEGNSSGSNFATVSAAFKSAWFGSNVPANFTIGYYYGSGVSLSQTTDAVNIFDSTGATVTRVDFNASSLGQTFDNKAGLNNAVLSTMSVAGVNGAFTSANGVEVGSPGVVPLPGTLPLLLSAFGVIGGAARTRRAR